MIDELWALKEKDLKEEVAEYGMHYEVFDTFESYKKTCSKLTGENQDKLQILLAFK